MFYISVRFLILFIFINTLFKPWTFTNANNFGLAIDSAHLELFHALLAIGRMPFLWHPCCYVNESWVNVISRSHPSHPQWQFLIRQRPVTWRQPWLVSFIFTCPHKHEQLQSLNKTIPNVYGCNWANFEFSRT